LNKIDNDLGFSRNITKKMFTSILFLVNFRNWFLEFWNQSIAKII